MRFLLFVLLLAVPCFAAGTEVPAIVAPLLPPELVSSLVTLLVSAVLSGIASGFNAFLKSQKRRGGRSGRAVMALGVGLNATAFNFDKVVAQAKAVKKGAPAVPAAKPEVKP